MCIEGNRYKQKVYYKMNNIGGNGRLGGDMNHTYPNTNNDANAQQNPYIQQQQQQQYMNHAQHNQQHAMPQQTMSNMHTGQPPVRRENTGDNGYITSTNSNNSLNPNMASVNANSIPRSPHMGAMPTSPMTYDANQ
ncbi:hypothetical protein SARC_13108, partial [Sphaeroforma arctica JP610]